MIRPESALTIGRVEKNPEKLKSVYELGRLAAEKCIDDLKAFLETR